MLDFNRHLSHNESEKFRNEKQELNVRIWKNKLFARFARGQRISDSDLCDAIERAERGLIDADLGGNVIKQRVARPNEGRSGGFRTIILFRVEERAFFIHGYAKSSQANISTDEVKAFRRAAEVALQLDEEQIQTLLDDGELIEVNCDEEDL